MFDAMNDADVAAKWEARETWTADRAQLVFQYPLNASLALQLEIVPVVDERLPTAATDGRAVFVNPYWLRTLAPAERLFVLAHEVWHNALLHFLRRGGRDAVRWNVAIDHEVNALLKREGFSMPTSAVYLPEFDTLGAEQVYERLDGSETGVRPAGADVHLGSEESGSEGPDDDVFGPIEGKIDADYKARMDEAAAGEWAARIVAMGQLLPGHLPGAVRRAIDQVTKATLPWSWLLRDFITRSSGGRLAWLPPSRRHVHKGLYLPSRRGDLLRAAVAIDTSGSTTPHWPRFLAELRQMLRSFGRYEIRLLECDAAITRDAVYDEARRLPERVDFSGGGGTDFSPVFQRLAGAAPDALVFLTDGYGTCPTEAPGYPVMWVLTPEGVTPAPWGRAIQMPPTERPSASVSGLPPQRRHSGLARGRVV